MELGSEWPSLCQTLYRQDPATKNPHGSCNLPTLFPWETFSNKPEVTQLEKVTKVQIWADTFLRLSLSERKEQH